MIEHNLGRVHSRRRFNGLPEERERERKCISEWRGAEETRVKAVAKKGSLRNSSPCNLLLR